MSLERMDQARRIFDDGDGYALAMYCGGLAVESLLRAFRWSEDRSFEGRHDLPELLKASGLLRVDEEDRRRDQVAGAEDRARKVNLDLRVEVNSVAALWHNNLRYASEKSLMAFLKSAGRTRRLKGDALRKNARELLESAQRIINRGQILWVSRKRS
ncbi:hypothetical protein [Aquisphaera insulae]|uniref:hypothetical protein n=1 Tax=Aquisphaera insulae TaxID=2712864 RepID=UPI0013EDAB95|nr:hypothetical protein [Aquisphaera insulae]